MKREFLSELGLSEEKIEAIMAEYGKSINSTKDELDKYKQENKALKDDRDSLQEQIQERDKQLDKLSKQAEGHEELKQEIDNLKQANEDTKKQYEQKLKETTFDYALEKALLQAKARNPVAVKPFINKEIIQLNEDNQLIGLNEQLEKLKEEESYLFESAEEGNNSQSDTTFKAGSDKKTNNPKKVDARELGKQKALERFKKGDEE